MARRLRVASGVLLLAIALVYRGQAIGQETPTKLEESPKLAEIFKGGTPASLADLKAMQTHVQALAVKVLPATVGVRVGAAQGSGVIIDKAGHVLTAAHVCGKPGRDVVFVFPDGKSVKGKTLGVNTGIDAGLMKITEEGDWPTVDMGEFDSIKTGQWVLATGHPGGYQQDRGVVVRLGRILSKSNGALSTDCTLVGGDSGGPLFDMEGRVIGIHSRIGGSLKSNIHVPIGTYKLTWDRLVAAEEWGGRLGGGGGEEGGPFIGVVGDPDGEKGAKIVEVQSDSPAATAGILVDDVIIEFDGHPIADFDSLSSLVRTKKPGAMVKLKVSRGDATLDLELVVGKRK
jgi:serine protease Do